MRTRARLLRAPKRVTSPLARLAAVAVGLLALVPAVPASAVAADTLPSNGTVGAQVAAGEAPVGVLFYQLDQCLNGSLAANFNIAGWGTTYYGTAKLYCGDSSKGAKHIHARHGSLLGSGGDKFMACMDKVFGNGAMIGGGNIPDTYRFRYTWTHPAIPGSQFHADAIVDQYTGYIYTAFTNGGSGNNWGNCAEL